MTPEIATQDSTFEKPEIDAKRNFFLAVINGIIYIFAEALLDPTLVLVGFVSHLTQNPILLGLVLPIRDASWSLPQLWVSGFLQNRPLKIRFYQQMSLVRILGWGLLAFSMNLILSPRWMLVTFFAAFTFASLASGIGGLPFLEVVSKTIPPQRRGEMFAWRLGAGGLLGIGGSLLVRWLVSNASPFLFPHNFGVLAIGFFLCASFSLMLFNRIHEEPDQNMAPRRKTREQWRRALSVLKTNQNYGRLLSTQALMILSTMAIPFFAIYVQQQFQVDPQWVGIYLGVLMVSNLLSNIYLGSVSRKKDNQKVMHLAAAAGGGMNLLMLVLSVLGKPLQFNSSVAAFWLVPVFFLSGMRGTGFGIASSSLLLNLAQPEERTLMIGFNQFLVGLFILATSVSGLLVKALGFTPLVILTLLIQIGAWIFAGRLQDKTDA